MIQEETFIIYGKGRPAMIKGITLTPKQNHQAMVPFTDLSQPTALDFDIKEQYIYYSDVQRYILYIFAFRKIFFIIDFNIPNFQGCNPTTAY